MIHAMITTAFIRTTAPRFNKRLKRFFGFTIGKVNHLLHGVHAQKEAVARPIGTVKRHNHPILYRVRCDCIGIAVAVFAVVEKGGSVFCMVQNCGHGVILWGSFGPGFGWFSMESEKD